MMPRKDLTGQTFGRLTAIRPLQTRINGHVAWEFQCSCGKVVKYSGAQVVCGNTNSCGCFRVDCLKLRAKHGYTNTTDKHKRPYKTWQGMKDRCTRPTHYGYKYYGAKGITVCKRWLTFVNFLEDMGVPPSKGHSLDRLDSSKGYYKENCKWATSKEQSRNKSNTRLITIQGVTKGFTEWCDLSTLPKYVIRSRFYTYKWSIERALTEPLHK